MNGTNNKTKRQLEMLQLIFATVGKFQVWGIGFELEFKSRICSSHQLDSDCKVYKWPLCGPQSSRGSNEAWNNL